MQDFAAIMIATTALVAAVQGLITALAALLWSYRQSRQIRETKHVVHTMQHPNGCQHPPAGPGPN